jgi:cytochrome b561
MQENKPDDSPLPAEAEALQRPGRSQMKTSAPEKTSAPVQAAATEPPHEIYDPMTIRLHWTVALLVAALWLMGRTIGFLPRGTLRIDLWSLHVLFGFGLAGVLILRIVWRLTCARRLPAADRGALRLLAVTTHRAIYVLLLAIVALGVINVFARGFPLFNVWHFPKLGQDDFARTINAWHDLVANVVAATVALHAAAALFHHYVVKDTVLRRMWPAMPAPRGPTRR